MYTVSLEKFIQKMKVKNLTPDVDISAIEITQSDVNRPALQLAGFFDYFDHHRIQIIGQVEHTYMEKQGIEESLKQMKRILSYKVPGIVFAVICRCRKSFCSWRTNMRFRFYSHTLTLLHFPLRLRDG